MTSGVDDYTKPGMDSVVRTERCRVPHLFEKWVTET